MSEDKKHTLADAAVGDIVEYNHPTRGICLVYVMEPLRDIELNGFMRIGQYKNGNAAWLIERPSLMHINFIARKNMEAK